MQRQITGKGLAHFLGLARVDFETRKRDEEKSLVIPPITDTENKERSVSFIKSDEQLEEAMEACINVLWVVHFEPDHVDDMVNKVMKMLHLNPDDVAAYMFAIESTQEKNVNEEFTSIRKKSSSGNVSSLGSFGNVDKTPTPEETYSLRPHYSISTNLC